MTKTDETPVAPSGDPWKQLFEHDYWCPDLSCIRWVNMAKVKELLATERQLARAREAEKDEISRMQHAAITAAALGNTETSKAQRVGRENPYWTPAYQDVCDAVDREIELRAREAALQTEIDQLKAIYEPAPDTQIRGTI